MSGDTQRSGTAPRGLALPLQSLPVSISLVIFRSKNAVHAGCFEVIPPRFVVVVVL